MLAANWRNHDTKNIHITNYFADRQHTEKILKDQEYFIATSCKYYKNCQKCKKFYNYRDEFKKKGFWTFNKDGK